MPESVAEGNGLGIGLGSCEGVCEGTPAIDTVTGEHVVRSQAIKKIYDRTFFLRWIARDYR